MNVSSVELIKIKDDWLLAILFSNDKRLGIKIVKDSPVVILIMSLVSFTALLIEKSK